MTVHTVLQAMPTQLMFGQDVILNVPCKLGWQQVQMSKQALIKKDNACENARQIPHACNVGDKVLVTMDALD